MAAALAALVVVTYLLPRAAIGSACAAVALLAVALLASALRFVPDWILAGPFVAGATALAAAAGATVLAVARVTAP